MGVFKYILFFTIFVNVAALAQDHQSGKLHLSSAGGIWQSKHSPELDLTNEVTLEATVFFPTEQHSGARIIDKLQSNSGSGGFALGIAENNELWMVAGQQHLTSNQRVPLNKWVRLIGTFSKEKNQFKLYIDSTEVSTSSNAALVSMTRTNFPLRIGADADGKNQLTADVRQVVIYNKFLSKQDITGGKGLKGRVIDWHFLKDDQAEYISATKVAQKLTKLRSVTGVDQFGDTADILWYQKPSSQWETALPVGNGRLGAMIFAGTDRERYQLNDVSVWSGSPQPDADRPDAYKHLPEVRQAIRAQKYELAEKLTNQYMTSEAPYNASYQTLGELSVQFDLPKGEATQYKRWLDISNAVSGVSFKIGQTQYSRETFSSATDQAIVSILKSSAKGGISFTLDLTRLENAVTVTQGPDMLIMTGNTGKSLDFEVQVKVVTVGGKVSASANELIVNAADQAIVYLTAGTSFIMDYEKAYKGEHPHSKVTRQMNKVSERSYTDLLNRHINDYQQYFNRVRLDLGSSPAAALPTDDRLKQYGDGKNDPSFAALFYHYGRYLLISSSRPDNLLPSNSQGIWGDGLSLPWQCDYKSNINYQMNYWQAEQSNLSELHMPMLRQTQSLQTAGAKTAKAYFGPDTPGWYYGYTTNGWGWTSPGARLSWGVFAGGSGWTCQHLWEHYAFTRDKSYLQSVYPTLKGAAEFYLATMIEDKNGNLITSPSTSPENYFKTDDGQKASVSEGNTMECSIIWDLFDNIVHANQVLGTDTDFSKKIAVARDKIKKLQIGRNGQLMEWGDDWDMNSDDLEHRHVSHLFALHPGHQITALGTPEYASAAKKSLEIRGNDGTGWSLAWKVNFWARLREGEQVYRLLSNQLRYTEQTKTIMAGAGGTYPNLFDAHPPFQIDGNFGAVSGITEMLLQSMETYAPDKYIIDLLPAIPSQWKTGSVKGLRARGGFEISMQWKNKEPVNIQIQSLNGEKCIIRSATKLSVEGIKANSKLEGIYFLTTFDTERGRTYNLNPK